MVNSDLVSIITPCFNCSKYLSQMIDSVIAQTYQNWELLITDDCSTDNSYDIAAAYTKKDSRIKLFKLGQNSGAGVARNNSIEKAQGRYIAFLDSDDLWMPEKLEHQMEFIKTNKYKFVFCQALVIDVDGNVVGFNKRRPVVSFNSTKILNYIGTSGVLYDTKEIGKFYMKPIRRRQDWVLWLDLLKVTNYAYCLQEPLSCWRKGDSESLSAHKSKLLKYHRTIYHDYLGYSVFSSYFMFYFKSLPRIIMKKIGYKRDSKEYLKKIER